MLYLLLLSGSLPVAVALWLRRPVFGGTPRGQRLQRMEKSPNYSGGQFYNQHPTPSLTEGYSAAGVFLEFFFKRKKDRKPPFVLPGTFTNLHTLPDDRDVLVWFGHSSYFLKLQGRTFLVDPVFSGNASPLNNMVKAYKGTDRYTVNDLPPIDHLLITHDHYDHLDHPTITALKPKVKQVICGLGVGAHFERWGYDDRIVTEEDWNSVIDLGNGYTLTTAPARHFSGRKLKRNTTLWLSFVLQTPTKKIFLGGDSGYDTHFAAIGRMFGPFDLAILENGQYDKKWRYIHALPAEVLVAARDLKARRLLPVHSMKFGMANHTWDDPLNSITELNRDFGQNIITPLIGQAVWLDDESQRFSEWWRGQHQDPFPKLDT